MLRVEIRRLIERPIEDVFERLVDIDRYPDWMPAGGMFRSCTKDSEGPVGEGTRYTDHTVLGAVPGEIVEFEPPHRVVFRYDARLFGVPVMRGWPGYTLEHAGEGRTRLIHVAEARLVGPFNAFRPLIQRVAEGERGRTVDALERSFETED